MILHRPPRLHSGDPYPSHLRDTPSAPRLHSGASPRPYPSHEQTTRLAVTRPAVGFHRPGWTTAAAAAISVGRMHYTCVCLLRAAIVPGGSETTGCHCVCRLRAAGVAGGSVSDSSSVRCRRLSRRPGPFPSRLLVCRLRAASATRLAAAAGLEKGSVGLRHR